MAINTPGNTDDGQICQNCADIFTEALENFLSPFVKDPVPTTPPHTDVRPSQSHKQHWMVKDRRKRTVKGRRKWECQWSGTHVLSDAHSSQFGMSPLQCYVCFRTSQLAKMAGVKRLELAFNSRADCINARFEGEAKSWKIAFHLTLADCEKGFKPSSPNFLRLT